MMTYNNINVIHSLLNVFKNIKFWHDTIILKLLKMVGKYLTTSIVVFLLQFVFNYISL